MKYDQVYQIYEDPEGIYYSEPFSELYDYYLTQESKPTVGEINKGVQSEQQFQMKVKDKYQKLQAKQQPQGAVPMKFASSFSFGSKKK